MSGIAPATALGAFDQLVAQMVAMNIPREKAEAAARAELGMHSRSALEQMREDADANALEKDEQAECLRIYRAHNCVVYNTSQYRPAKISAGLADLIVFAPRVHRFAFHEVKRTTGGVQSPAQAVFQEHCDECQVTYIIGDRSTAWSLLREWGLAGLQAANVTVVP